MEHIKNKYPEIPIGRAKDLTGKKFGRLTALYRTETVKGRTYWVFQCECGNYHRGDAGEVTRTDRSGIKSCGCLTSELSRERIKTLNNKKRIDRTGRKDGMLTAIKDTGKSIRNRAVWLYKCDCGNEIELMANDVESNKFRSCGCTIMSIGEQKVDRVLKRSGLDYKKQITFEDCRNPKTGHVLYFDFIIYEDDAPVIAVEYDGEQHFNSSDFFGGEEGLKDLQYRDNYKNEYCKENNITMVRIPYYKIDEITLKMILEGGETQ